jgi:hypothetical protein
MSVHVYETACMMREIREVREWTVSEIEDRDSVYSVCLKSVQEGHLPQGRHHVYGHAYS